MSLNHVKEAAKLTAKLAELRNGQAMVTAIAEFLEQYAERARQADFDELLERSSLGASDVREAASRTSPEVVDKILKRVAERDREEKEQHDAEVRVRERSRTARKVLDAVRSHVADDDVNLLNAIGRLREEYDSDRFAAANSFRITMDDEAARICDNLARKTGAGTPHHVLRDALGTYNALFELLTVAIPQGGHLMLVYDDGTAQSLVIPTFDKYGDTPESNVLALPSQPRRGSIDELKAAFDDVELLPHQHLALLELVRLARGGTP